MRLLCVRTGMITQDNAGSKAGCWCSGFTVTAAQQHIRLMWILMSRAARWLCSLQVVCGTMGLPTCTVQLKGPDSITRVAVGVGTGEGGCLDAFACGMRRSFCFACSYTCGIFHQCFPHMRCRRHVVPLLTTPTVRNDAVVSAACNHWCHHKDC